MNSSNEGITLIQITHLYIQRVAAGKFYNYLTDEEIEDVKLEIAAKLQKYVEGAISEVRAYNELVGYSREVLCPPPRKEVSTEKPPLE